MEAHAAVLHEIEQALGARHDLLLTEFDTLVNIPPTDGIRHRELTEQVILSQSAVSRLLTRLEARGLLTRSEAPSDSRGTLIHLTDAGRNLRRRAAVTNADVVERRFASRLSEDQLDLVFEVFAGLTEHRADDSGPV